MNKEALISRDIALEKMADYVASGYADSAEDFEEYSRIICQLPSVTQKSGKWIPVSERLPEKNVEVLVTTEWDCITIGEMFSNNDWFIHEGATNAVIDDIKAWMPLPKPYEPQERNDKE